MEEEIKEKDSNWPLVAGWGIALILCVIVLLVWGIITDYRDKERWEAQQQKQDSGYLYTP